MWAQNKEAESGTLLPPLDDRLVNESDLPATVLAEELECDEADFAWPMGAVMTPDPKSLGAYGETLVVAAVVG